MDDKPCPSLGDVLTLCSEYGTEHQKDGLAIKLPTTPWRVVSDFKAFPEYASEKGIYIFCEPAPNNVEIGSHTETVLYIGKAESRKTRPLAGRIYAHFGPVNSADRLPFIDPPSPRHDWHESPGISARLKQAVANRAINVYSVAVTCQGISGPYISDLESFLLNRLKIRGKWPPLNRQNQARKDLQK
jgi:hypothetical protein